jgi:hypothetical protein
MASKKTKAKKRKKPSPRAAVTKRSKTKKAPTRPAKRTPEPRKKAAPKKPGPKAAKKRAVLRPLKTFADKVRDRDPATEVWYRVGDVLSHGVMLGSGAAGDVMVVSNGVVSGVPPEDLFETQAAAAGR